MTTSTVGISLEEPLGDTSRCTEPRGRSKAMHAIVDSGTKMPHPGMEGH
jgi:hypothetical protein